MVGNKKVVPSPEESQDGKDHEKELEQFAKLLNQKVTWGCTQANVAFALDILLGKVSSETVVCYLESLKIIFTKLYRLQLLQQKWVNKMDKDEDIQPIWKVDIHMLAHKRKRRSPENPV